MPNPLYDPKHPDSPEQQSRQRGESAMLDTYRRGLNRQEIGEAATGDELELVEQHKKVVSPSELKRQFWTQLEGKYKMNDLNEAEELAAKIKGESESEADAEAVERDKEHLSQTERLQKAEQAIDRFLTELAETLARVMNEKSHEIRVTEKDSVDRETTRQLGEAGDLNFFIDSKEVGQDIVAALKAMNVELSGYERAFSDPTREGFALENRDLDLRLMFVYDLHEGKPETVHKERAVEPTPEQQAPADVQAASTTAAAVEQPFATGTDEKQVGQQVDFAQMQQQALQRKAQEDRNYDPLKPLFDVDEDKKKAV